MWRIIVAFCNLYTYGVSWIHKKFRKFFYPDPEGTRAMAVISKNGYPVEKHVVQTEDGYLLTMHRIPYGIKPGSGAAEGKRAILLQHGLLCSSSEWLLMGSDKSLAFILADAGYDVWMGNARGNKYSKEHIRLGSNDREYWDFSWHEIGQFDLPAMIDYILEETSQSKLHYVGHSQGCTSFFVMTALRPEYNSKISSMHALAPNAFMGNCRSLSYNQLSRHVFRLEKISNFFGVHSFGVKILVKKWFWNLKIFQECVIFYLGMNDGFNSNQFDRKLVPELLSNMPAGSSMRQIYHYFQLVRSNEFRMYDFGEKKNLQKYGSAVPPDYNLGNLACPTILYYADNDYTLAVDNIDRLIDQMGKYWVQKFRVSDPKWNHHNYVWGIDADKYVYKHVLEFLQKY